MKLKRERTTSLFSIEQLMKLKLYFTVGKIALLFLMPIVLVILPADYFDKGQSLCISVLLLKTECYACGITRAIMHLIHFQFEDAFDYNMMSFIVLPLLIVLWIQWILKEIKIFKSLNKGARNQLH